MLHLTWSRTAPDCAAVLPHTSHSVVIQLTGAWKEAADNSFISQACASDLCEEGGDTMKTWQVFILVVALIAAAVPAFAADKPKSDVPKYDPASEAKFKGVVDQVTDRQCPVSGGMGSHVTIKLGDGKTIEVHIAATKFVKSYDVVFNKGDELEVTGVKVNFEGVETVFAREIKRGQDTFVFRDKDGKPVW